ncbi:MAG: hypothetical protein BZY87_07550 [SAR202 cluster bacterium Io17-Chloro-G6]|nr:MAG: hypothetical protein BZY87_07550 [SAR202 cluster bacterium Io17-Chloro-G6]
MVRNHIYQRGVDKYAAHQNHTSLTIRAWILQLHPGISWVVFCLGLFVVGDLIFGNPSDSPEGTRHALAHLSTGVPLLLLALTAYGLWRPRNLFLRVARVLFILLTLVFGAGQIEHSVGVYAGDPPHIVAKITPSQAAVVSLGILLGIANMVKALRFRVHHTSA